MHIENMFKRRYQENYQIYNSVDSMAHATCTHTKKQVEKRKQF